MKADLWNQGFTLLDGAMGTMLQKMDLPQGCEPELLALSRPETLSAIHRAYVEAGSQVVCANTFGCNAKKLAGSGHSVAQVVAASVAAARAAGPQAVALDVGALGERLEPLGTLRFEEAYGLFRQVMEAGARAGADLIFIETMTDLYEARAALLAAKEATTLPVFVSMSFDPAGRSFTGCTVASMAATLEGLGADAIGFNCSPGPDTLAPLVAELSRHTRLPIIAKPNAGLPHPVDGSYGIDAAAFRAAMARCVEAGATLVGGCCGTTPAYIAEVGALLGGLQPAKRC